MVSINSMINMIISAIIVVIAVVGLVIYFRKNENISYKPIIFGAICFILFSQVFEKAIHYVVITNNLIKNPVLFGIYGILMAGIFEEVGRYIVYKKFLKGYRKWKDGVAFGLGHGGIEAILLGILIVVNYMVISIMINSGNFDQLIGTQIPIETANELKLMLTGPSSGFLAIGFERLCALVIQIALSILVLYSINIENIKYLFVAIILHAIIDIPAILYQMKVIGNVWIVEGVILLFAVVAFMYIKKSKKIYKDKNLDL